MNTNNKKTTRINQDAFVEHDALPGNISPALSNDIVSNGVRTESLHITSYTAGDTSGKPDRGLPEVSEANTPKRISRKYIPLQSGGGKAQDAVFPQSGDESEFSWKPHGFKHDDFVSVKDAKAVNAAPIQEKGGPSREVLGLLKQLGHTDASDVGESRQVATSTTVQEKAITVNLSPTNLTNVEFGNYISTTVNDNRTYNHTYNVDSGTVVRPSSIFVNRQTTKPRESNANFGNIESDSHNQNDKLHEGEIKLNNKVSGSEPNSVSNPIAPKTRISSNNISESKVIDVNEPKGTSEVPIVPRRQSNTTSKINHGSSPGHNDADVNIPQSDAEVYEQVRSILGESRQDWKQVIKTAKSTVNTSTNVAVSGNNTLPNHEVQIEQAIQKILSQESNNRAELEHMLTHRFSTEITAMQQSMNKKIQDLRETFSNFMMR